MGVDKKRIDRLNAGEVPSYEPGLAELMYMNAVAGRLIFSSEMK